MWRRIRLNFLTGLLVLLPLYLTGLILVKLFLIIDGILNRLVTRAVVAALRLPISDDQVFYGLGIVTLFFVILGVGSLARNFIGKKVLAGFNRKIDRIPIIKSIYKTLRQIIEALLSTNREAFQKPVLIEYPRQGLYSVAFQTQASGGPLQENIGEESITVFLPSTPNPTTGFVLIVPKSQVHEINMSTEDAMKLIISGGVIAGEKKEP
ncbi:MAG TPA: DUF502 domain-containing protein [bacterium]|jgi:uncharacterized membrane protein